jgi:hypothetical protein
MANNFHETSASLGIENTILFTLHRSLNNIIANHVAKVLLQAGGVLHYHITRDRLKGWLMAACKKEGFGCFARGCLLNRVMTLF